MFSFTFNPCNYFQYYSTCTPMTMNCVEVVLGYRHSKIDAVRSILGWALCVSKAMSEVQYWMRNVLISEDKPQDQLISDSIVWNHEAAKIQVEVCVFGNYVKKLMAYINKHVGECSYVLWALFKLRLHSIIVSSSKLLNKIIFW